MTYSVYRGLAPLVEGYDAFIVDLWGTLHNGIAPLPGAVECLAELKRRGKGVALLSNAPFRSDQVLDVLATIGVPDDVYDCVLSSGEMAWRALATRDDPWHAALGRRAAFIGPDRHRPMLENPGVDPVEDIADADFILCTGPIHAGATLDEYEDQLRAAAAHKLPMVCANPDREVLRGNTREICAGAIAARYAETYAGDVAWHGKPYASVFTEILHMLGDCAPERALMIGDGMGTDIAGGHEASAGTALICGGIHAQRLGIERDELPAADRLQALFADYPAAPDFVLPGLRW